MSAELRGNPWWSLAYALSSLKNYPVRNLGIALILSIGVALPTTVFIWTATGTDITVDSFFEADPVQLALRPESDATAQTSNLLRAVSFAENNRFIESSYIIPSTVGILTGNFLPHYTSYYLYNTNYFYGIKDFTTLLVTNEFLNKSASWFQIEGNYSLSPNEVLVSSIWVDWTYECHGVTIEIGDTIDFDLLTISSESGGGFRSSLGPVSLSNMTVAGIYTFKTRSSLGPSAFPAISRKNWDPFGYTDTVFGIRDSIMILESEVSEDDADIIINRGWFNPAAFLVPSVENLKTVGAINIISTLINLKAQIEEEFPLVYTDGLYELWRLGAFITTYLNSQVLTVIALPILVMSLMLTVFTSETSVARRKGEISALRAKGASFNQIFSTFMWESVFLSLLGFAAGITLAVFMAPLIASSNGLFQFEMEVYLLYLSRTQLSIFVIVLAAVISLFLPASYLVHVARRIDVVEIGQPISEEPEEVSEDVHIRKYAIGLAGVMVILLATPLLLSSTGPLAILQIVFATLLLFAAAYLGSRFMQVVTAKLSSGTSFFMGEKTLYLSQSLRRRRRQFIPLLVILTLTLTTTMMMVIQSSSFESTVNNEIRYAIGCDMRIECNNRLIRFNSTLLTYPGIRNVTPVAETWGQVGSTTFTIAGVNPAIYAGIGAFNQESFLGVNAEEILFQLANTTNGVIVSQYHLSLWNKTVGDEIRVVFGGAGGARVAYFQIVGSMVSAPGLGLAAPISETDSTVGTIFDFQIKNNGFVLVNLDFLAERGSLNRVDLFLANTLPYVNLTSSIKSINSLYEVNVYTPDTFRLAARSYSLGLFMSGFQGLTMIGFVTCTIMGLSALALFLGSAVLERQSEYALFRALGGTKKQVVILVFGEFSGTVITSIAISAILGILFGFSMGVMSFGISPFSPILAEVLSFPIMILLTILVMESIVMLVSCYIPARRAGSIDPSTTLRNL